MFLYLNSLTLNLHYSAEFSFITSISVCSFAISVYSFLAFEVFKVSSFCLSFTLLLSYSWLTFQYRVLFPYTYLHQFLFGVSFFLLRFRLSTALLFLLLDAPFHTISSIAVSFTPFFTPVLLSAFYRDRFSSPFLLQYSFSLRLGFNSLLFHVAFQRDLYLQFHMVFTFYSFSSLCYLLYSYIALIHPCPVSPFSLYPSLIPFPLSPLLLPLAHSLLTYLLMICATTRNLTDHSFPTICPITPNLTMLYFPNLFWQLIFFATLRITAPHPFLFLSRTFLFTWFTPSLPNTPLLHLS